MIRMLEEIQFFWQMLIPEIIDHILYYTTNPVTELCLVCKYFN